MRPYLLLTALAPELSLTEVVDRGSRLGVGRDDRGWFLACAATALASNSAASFCQPASRSGGTGPGNAT